MNHKSCSGVLAAKVCPSSVNESMRIDDFARVSKVCVASFSFNLGLF